MGAVQPFMPDFSTMTHKAGKFENLPRTAGNGAPFPADHAEGSTPLGLFGLKGAWLT